MKVKILKVKKKNKLKKIKNKFSNSKCLKTVNKFRVNLSVFKHPLLYSKSIYLFKLPFENSLIINKKSEKRINYFYVLNILFASNNIFFNFTNGKGKSFIGPISSNFYSFKVSKKNKSFFFKEVLLKFIEDLKKFNFRNAEPKENINKKTNRTMAIRVNVSQKARKKVLKIIQSTFLKNFQRSFFFIIDVSSSKTFNGCRGKKLRRKKRIRLKNLGLKSLR